MKPARSILSVLLSFIILSGLCVPAWALIYTPDVEIGAGAYYLYNMDNDTLIAEHNMDERMYPASLTKIMTCILAIENTADLDREMLTYPNYVQDYLYNYQWVQGNGAVSLGGLEAGETLSMRQMLYAIMLPSANEAAMIIADHIGGSQEGFAEMMNRRAKELGAVNTHFVNPNGLHDPEHYTTAHDIALITMHTMELPGFMDIVTTTSYDSGPTNKRESITWDTTNKMQVPGSSYYYSGLRGIKTGSTPDAGACLVSTCTQDGFTYLLVVMGSPYLDENGAALPQTGSFVDTANLYDWAFQNFQYKMLVDKATQVSEIPLRLSTQKDHLSLATGDRLSALVPVTTKVTDVTMVPEIPDSWDAPVEKGDVIGELRLTLAGEELGRVPLVAAESIDASPMLLILEKTKQVMKSFWFKFIIILIALLIVLYIILIILRNRNRRRRGGYRPRRRL